MAIFIAQLKLSASYGLGQIMFLSAYTVGFRGELDELCDRDINLKYSLKFLAAVKFKEGSCKLLDTLIEPDEWYIKWNDTLKKYNGGITNYVEKVRNGEKQYIK